MSYQYEQDGELFKYELDYNVGTPVAFVAHEWIDGEGWEDGVVWKDNEEVTVTRYFALLDPVLNAHYALSTPITMSAGDTASIEFVAPVGIVGSSGYIFGGSGATDRGYVFLNTLGNFQVNEAVISTLELDGVQVALNSAYPLDGKLHTLKVTYSSTAKIGFIGCRYTVSLFFNGILANAKFTSNSGTPVTTTFKLDTATGNTEQSVEGNNTATFVNIPPLNREEYSNAVTQWDNLNPINLPTVIEVA